MKAAYIERYGGPDVLRLGDQPKPVPGPGDLLVEVHAASVNPVDFKIRKGLMRAVQPFRFPLILGNDLAGVVAGAGSGATAFAPGDRIYARLDTGRIGAFAEYALVSERNAARMPANLDFPAAASLPLAGLTAWQALGDVGHVKPGDRVLIHAGAGGVGSLAIQFAKHLGAHVIATASASDAERLRALGAGEVVDYRSRRFEDVVREVDMVFSTAGGDTIERSIGVLKRGGVLVDIAGMPTAAWGKRQGLNPLICVGLAWMTRRVASAARRRGVQYEYLFMKPSGEQLAAIARLVEAGTVRPIIDQVFAFDQVREAIAHVEAGHAKGKVVVRIRG